MNEYKYAQTKLNEGMNIGRLVWKREGLVKMIIGRLCVVEHYYWRLKRRDRP